MKTVEWNKSLRLVNENINSQRKRYVLVAKSICIQISKKSRLL